MIPYIFVFDIDRTIIGDVSYCTSESYLNSISRNKSKIKNKNIEDYSNDLQNGLLRPYFIDFIFFCKKKYKPCIFYINTKSTTKWAHTIIKNIENVCKIKFSKPIFTREDTILSEKSLKSLVDLLSIKYNSTNEIISNKLIFIDDLPSNTNTYKERQIKCPSYNCLIYRDIYNNLLDKYGIDIMNNHIIEEEFIRYDIPYFNEKSNNPICKNKEYYELNKILQIKGTEIINAECKDDDFFKILQEKLKDLSNKNIKNINDFFNKK